MISRTKEETQRYCSLYYPVIVSEGQKNIEDLKQIGATLKKKKVNYIIGQHKGMYILCRQLDKKDKKNKDFMNALDKMQAGNNCIELYPGKILKWNLK